MTCTKLKTKKYQTRKGPAYHAKDCKGLTKKGNDKKPYISSPDKRGIYKWTLKANGKVAQVTQKKKGIKTYKIYDNGSEPFAVDVSPSRIEIYKQIFIEDGDKYVRDKKIHDSSYKKIFIGDNDLRIKEGLPKGKYPGNSILIQTGPGKYTYVGSEIYAFETKNGEEIKAYYSPIGNSLSYPYAIGENNSYFMLDKQSVPNSLLDLKKDGYAQFYGYIIKDEEKKQQLEASKKIFKTKQIHKRHMP